MSLLQPPDLVTKNQKSARRETWMVGDLAVIR